MFHFPPTNEWASIMKNFLPEQAALWDGSRVTNGLDPRNETEPRYMGRHSARRRINNRGPQPAERAQTRRSGAWSVRGQLALGTVSGGLHPEPALPSDGCLPWSYRMMDGWLRAWPL